MVKTKKFGANNINAVNYATEVVSDALTAEVSEASSPSAPLQPSTISPAEQPVTSPSPSQEGGGVATPQPTPATPEKKKGVVVEFSKEDYMRLIAMKMQQDDETLKSICHKAVLEYLQKMGY